MAKPEPKYRTHDSPPFVEPEVKYPPSLTDPSQYEPMSRLVERYMRDGGVPHGLPFGDDLSRVGFTELHAAAEAAGKNLEELMAKEKEPEVPPATPAAPPPPKAVEAELLPGSPEIQALAASLTRLLPGFELRPVPPKEGPDKKS